MGSPLVATSDVEVMAQTSREVSPTTIEPHPSIVRRQTVQFKNENGPAHFTTDEISDIPTSPIVPIQTRSGTIETNASKASSKVEEQWRKQTVLSFDGGGIRGYSSLLILKEIMKLVEEIEKKEDPRATSSFYPNDYVPPHDKRKLSDSDNGKRSSESCRYLPCHYFDYIGGTSTGGLIAIMLGRLRMGIDECLEEYETFGGEIFGHPRWFSLRGPLPSFKEKYNGKRLQRAVEHVVESRSSPEQKAVGAGYFGSARELCKTIVVAYRWKVKSSTPRYGNEVLDGIAVPNTPRAAPSEPGPYLFRSYDHWGTSDNDGGRSILERNPGAADNIPIWQVARATTAAPTYFDPIPIQNNTFGDGGLGSNNPVQEIYWEVAAMHGNDDSVVNLLVSIGTGEADHVNLHSSGLKKIISYFNATKALATESEEKHRNMRRLIANSKNSESVHYQRFNLPLEKGLKNMKLDEWKEGGRLRLTRRGIARRQESTLEEIARLTKEYCEMDQVKVEIRAVARKLVNHRRDRCIDQRKWELWATGIRYRCIVKSCDKSQKLRPSKDHLKYHIETIHPEYLLENAPGLLEEAIRKGTCPY